MVGFGRVGAAFGAALARAGHRVVAATASSTQARRRLFEQLPGAAVADPAAVAASSQLLVIAVPDDALGGLVTGLAATKSVSPGTLVVHPSGRYGVQILDPLTRQGALPLALHPAMTFSGSPADLARLTGAAFGVTAPAQLQPVAEALVIEMGGEPVLIREEDRLLYHTALAWASNYLVTLVVCAGELLMQLGVAAPRRMLGPLLGVALEATLQSGDAALTGPVARGDSGTVAAHVAALQQSGPELVDAYLALARLTADRAISRGRLDPAAAEALLDVLARRGPRS